MSLNVLPRALTYIACLAHETADALAAFAHVTPFAGATTRHEAITELDELCRNAVTTSVWRPRLRPDAVNGERHGPECLSNVQDTRGERVDHEIVASVAVVVPGGV